MLPAGYSWRPATLDDAPAIQALIADHDTKVIGYADGTLDDVRNQLTEPGLVIDADTWLVHSSDGILAAYAWTYARGTGEYIDLDVITLRPAVREWLFTQTLGRATELVRAGGHSEATLDIGVYRADTAASEVVAAHGFHHAATFYRMRVDHNPDIPPNPVAPVGVTLRSGPADLDFRRTAHEVLATSFKGHFGFGPAPFERWQDTLEAESTFDWSQLTVAYLDSQPAGILLTSDSHVEIDNCGSVSDLGVLPFARGQGIAKYLLHTAFAVDLRAGRTGTILYVDSNNTTGALRLYEGVGMRQTLVIDKWCKAI